MLSNMKIFKKKNGFTFIELLVTITIILIISTSAIVSFTSANKKARDNRRRTDLERIRTALELFRQEIGSYPGTAAIGNNYVQGNSGSGLVKAGGVGFIDVFPVDPAALSIGTSYYYNRLTQYTYEMAACLEVETGSGSGAAGLTCPSGAPSKIILNSP